MEDLLLKFLEGVAAFNFTNLAYGAGLIFAIIWIFVLFWAWKDISSRTENPFFRAFAVLLVLFLLLPGLIIYLIIRPKTTSDEVRWSDLERRYLEYETRELRDCSSCGFQLVPGFNFCPNCREQIKVRCNTCKVMVDKNWQYCFNCGSRTGGQYNSSRASNVQNVENIQVNSTNNLNGVVGNTVSIPVMIGDSVLSIFRVVRNGSRTFVMKSGEVISNLRTVRFELPNQGSGSRETNSEGANSSETSAQSADTNPQVASIDPSSTNEGK